MLNARRLAPGQYVLDVLGPALMSQAQVCHTHLASPAPVTIHNQTDMLWHRFASKLGSQPPGVQTIDEIAQ